MIDRIFNLTLTFALLIGSTLAIGADFYHPRTVSRQASTATVLPRVVITGSVVSETTLAEGDTRQGPRAR